MLPYVFALILLNIFYPSTGLPLKENTTRIPIANHLQNLANICENSVISDLIKSQIQNCNTSSEHADRKTEFKCIMFYDINSQLCSAFRRSKFDLKENYTTKMNEIQDIKSICNHAKSWKFTLKENYPKNESVDQVFKNDILCIQMCSEEDILSADSNFFCKYYQWGTDIIQSRSVVLAQQNSAAADPVFQQSILNPIENNANIANVQKPDNGSVSTSESVVKQIETKVIVPKDESTKAISSTDLSGQTSTINQQAGDNIVQKPIEVASPQKNTDQPVANAPTVLKNEIEKPPAEEEPPIKEEVEKEAEVPKESVIENPKVKQPVADIDEDQEDENDDEAEYVQGSDQDDAMKPLESDPNIDVKKLKNSLSGLLISSQNGHNVPLLDSETSIDMKPHKSRGGIDPMTSVSETFPNSMQDSYSEDDDHFFPFFLTAIIIVVLLYVLYHNKNKFTKLILGLLVEGRQTGRRRNSRGHAYRRLDTLEQAMNTNSAAPPSKIIY